ncbi:S-methyl-5'-thioinosine phosphorylase [Pigmentiphaga sp. GD03639]|jgi:5'-methylthioadenosine phosphorylase|uniref:Probable S-methyl-5'-thioinosine phosphorylase n=1 Tax=Pigmentiphaga daeguensis TaxID=414049 RepID=A0ABN1B427_9BURK|nr:MULTISPECIES: S-methyl-5'-thioinosine phosphorylase [unclassified Pigmentiphaga]MDH2236909.1 S-methyl-5'-thioinosine phosphorylase [Pigmentiphaga sp. GD03639]OVZ65660.1 5'-methylthioadenosine phosphorylase [Pigmentiphaga sp. NML030171]
MQAIIGGTGLYHLTGLVVTRRQVVRTPYGEPSGALTYGRIGDGAEIVFLARHGYGHTLAPHRINYRANLWALHEVGVRRIVSVATVGGIAGPLVPGVIVVPDQIIDYTTERPRTFFEGGDQPVAHVDMTQPYGAAMRHDLLESARTCGIDVVDGGVYGCTQGPRLETAAEIRRMGRDGCDMVGMTGMPEAALARELDLDYAALCLVTNDAAGQRASVDEISMQGMRVVVDDSMQNVHRILGQLVGTTCGDGAT